MSFELLWREFGQFSGAALYDLLRFRQAIFVVEQHSPYADLDGLDQHAHHLLLFDGGVIAGCLRLIPHPAENRVAIGRVAIGTTRRGTGLARRMIAEAMARCTRDYADWAMTLSAQQYLVPFYQSLGFDPVSAPYDDCGVPHVDMRFDRHPGEGRDPLVRCSGG